MGSDIVRARFFCICLIAFIILFQSNVTGFAKRQSTPMTCEERLKSLEPTEPKTVYDYELLRNRDINTFKEKVFPISIVQKKGTLVPFVTVYKDLDWLRPVYSPIWHSSSWRWSYVPLNMTYQRHIIYDYQGGLSWWYDLSSYLALPSGADGPSPINKYAFTIKYPYVVRLIVFNFNIKSMKLYKNQIVVTGEHLRKGLTVIDFDKKDFSDSKKLIQLATPDGYEIDYFIMY